MLIRIYIKTIIYFSSHSPYHGASPQDRGNSHRPVCRSDNFAHVAEPSGKRDDSYRNAECELKCENPSCGSRACARSHWHRSVFLGKD